MSKISDFFISKPGRESTVSKIYNHNATQSILSSIISIVIGLIFGIIIMVFIAIMNDKSPSVAFSGLGILLKGPFASKIKAYLLTNTGNVIFYAVPLIFTGLSVGVAYKTGLFNIGAPGQFIFGIMGSLTVALNIHTTNRFLGILVWILAIIVGMICGALWGVIPGVLKAFFNTNEVIICIMTNWIAANLATWYFSGQKAIISQENTKGAYLITTKVTGNGTPTLGLNNLFPGSYIDIGIIIAILVAIIIYIIMNKTTLGYELKACGANRNASKYAGLNEKRNIILSMVIAGALAGLGACLYYLNPGIEYNYVSQYSALPSYGFNGIASAFLANCNPIAIIFSSLFIRYLNMGGEYLTKVGFNRYIADIIIAVIIYTAGFSRIIREMLSRGKARREDRLNTLVVAPTEKEKPKEDPVSLNKEGGEN